MKKAITFYYDEESGELAKTTIHDDFKIVDSLMKADVLQDCLGTIENLYNNSNNQYWEKDLPKIIVENNE
jgi:hypothetical protein|tara:strand:- start:1682 stop:1891 length:210 start_codon:yes stop_codon:yes gene_type:complete